MELKRSRKLLVIALFFGLGGIFVLLFAGDRVSTRRLVFGSIGLVICLALSVREMRPFRFRITPAGLDVRHRDVHRPVPWAEAEAIVLEVPRTTDGTTGAEAPRLLLIPALDSDLRKHVTERHPLDGREALVLLDTSDVKTPVDDIARALAQAAGHRFADLRSVTPVAAKPSDFTMVLRGYAPLEVDTLVGAAEVAVRTGDHGQRQAMLANLAAQPGPRFAVALRGYDRGQVDAYLQQLAAQLAG